MSTWNNHQCKTRGAVLVYKLPELTPPLSYSSNGLGVVPGGSLLASHTSAPGGQCSCCLAICENIDKDRYMSE